MSDLSGRVGRLEAVVGNGGVVDLQAEAARYGELRWERGGARHYSRVTTEGSEMTTVGPHGAGVTYQVLGLDLNEVV